MRPKYPAGVPRHLGLRGREIREISWLSFEHFHPRYLGAPRPLTRDYACVLHIFTKQQGGINNESNQRRKQPENSSQSQVDME